MTLEILQYLRSSVINITVKELLRFKTANMFSREHVFWVTPAIRFFYIKLVTKA